MKPHPQTPYALVLVALAILTIGQAEDIRIPPSITKAPKRLITYSLAQPLVLPCEATGVPEPEFQWFHNGQVIDNMYGTVYDKGNLIISEATTIFQGTWQCFASNMYGKSMSSVTQLVMATIGSYPPEDIGQVISYTADPGEKLKLICNNLKSIPKASFSWSHIADEQDESGGDSVKITERIQIDDQGHLYFANIQSQDNLGGRLYKCNVFNSQMLVTKGGSLSRINVNPGSPTTRRPVLEYSTTSPTIGLRTRSITLKCLFSGNSAPRVQWQRVDGSLPFARHTFTDSGTTLTIDRLEMGDEGEYKCIGTNPEATAEAVIQLVIHSEPVFASETDRPMNDNYTEGETAVFKCHADAVPSAVAKWFINGEPVDRSNPGPRRSISDDGLQLTVENLCKDCTNDAGHTTDLMNIQCNASNTHNYTFADAYLNVLRPTVLTVVPEDVELVYGETVTFKCEATSDDSTPVIITWERDDKPIKLEPGRVEVTAENSLRIITEDEDDDGASFEGKYTCISTNSYSTATASALLTLPAGPAPVKGASMADLWWVFLIVAIILLLLILLFCCCLCMQRNRGDSYPVDEKERAQGNDPEKELEDNGYHDYQRPEDAPIKGSRASLTSTIKLDSDDEGSLNEYGGDLDTGKFNEDGSFIGQYIEKDKRRPKDSEV